MQEAHRRNKGDGHAPALPERGQAAHGVDRTYNSHLGNFVEKSLRGNSNTERCEHARDDAFRDMITHANQLNANAVIGVRYDATEIAPGITEVLCYGTAVQVEPGA